MGRKAPFREVQQAPPAGISEVVLQRLGSGLVEPWAPVSPVMTTGASGLLPEPVTLFPGEAGGHWKNQVG